jgi:hypothetical protein
MIEFTLLRLAVLLYLLATIAALATHFVLLRAPATLDVGSWRGPIGLWFLAVVAVAGFGAIYVARKSLERPAPTPV